MDRRDFLTGKKTKKSNVISFASPSRTSSGLNPYTGLWTTNEVIHLLKRTMFGAKKTDIDFFSAMSVTQAVNYLLNVSTAQTQPTPPLKNYANSVTITDLDNNVVSGQTWVNTNTADGTVNSNRINSFKNWWLGQMINQERNILEKLTLFWSNHFSTEADTVSNAIWSYQTNATIRANALGNFKTFVKAITLDVGMLRYLNGYANYAAAPDENYGRELQELFTVGKGANNATPPYSEADVKAAARLLTGWQINSTTNTSYFTASRHDTAGKQFSSFYNNTIIAGRSGATAGDMELNDLLSMIFATNEVAMTICRKLYRWFVYYTIDATIEANVITPLAQIFINSNYDIKTVLSALFKSEHFFDVQNQSCIIKSPVDNVVSVCREFNVQFPVATDYVGNYNCFQSLNSIAIAQNQNIGDPPNVAGWSPYYQEPQFHEIWINSDTFPKRNQFTDQMLGTGYTRNSANIKIDAISFAKTLPNPGDPNLLISDSIKYLLRLPLLQSSMDQLKKDIILSGQITDSYWTTAWQAYLANPADTTNANIVKTRLTSLYQYLLKLPEFQLS